MKKRKIILHIGFPKTGTTSLQVGLAEARGDLVQAGFCYPKSLGQTNQWHLEAYAQDFDRNLQTHTLLGLHSQADLDEFRTYCEVGLVAEVNELPDNVDTLVFSNEGLAGLHYPKEFDRLFHLMSKVGGVVQVIAYIRRQDLNAVSNYTTYLKHGGTRKNILQKYGANTVAYIFFGEKLKLWADLVGTEKISVRHFSQSEMLDGNLFRDFSSVVGFPETVNIEVETRANPSLSPAACLFLQSFNQKFPRFISGELNPLRSTVRETLETFFPGKGQLPARAAVAAYMEQFAEGNEYIRNTWFPDRSTLFDEDYSNYPEEEVTPSTEEVMTVFNKVWEQRLSQL